jgi:hypothetical protein
VREVLLAYLDHCRREAIEQYRFELLLFWIKAPNVKKDAKLTPPKLPEILRDE